MQVSSKAGKEPKFELGVSEAKLGSEIQEATRIRCVCNEFVGEIVRGLRLHAPRFLKGLEEMDLQRSQLGLAHSYSRAKVCASGGSLLHYLLRGDEQLNVVSQRAVIMLALPAGKSQ